MSVNLLKIYNIIRKFAGLWLLVLGCTFFYSSAYAESCWIGTGTLGLGTANIQGSATASTTFTVSCNSNYNQPISYKMCLVIDSTDPASYDPRSMINYSVYPAPLLNYNLYYNPALTQKIPNTSALTTAQCQSFSLSANSGNPSTTITIYGKLVAGQNVPAGDYHTNSMGLKLYYAYNLGTQIPSDSTALVGSAIATNNMIVNTTFENSCLIVSASDINFGSVDNLKSALTQSGTIQLSCPTGTTMKVSLNNGINAESSQRRMKNALGNYITYGLFQDASRTTSWQGNTAYTFSNQSIPVYAIVLSQSVPGTGEYSDTVTVTLTY